MTEMLADIKHSSFRIKPNVNKRIVIKHKKYVIYKCEKGNRSPLFLSIFGYKVLEDLMQLGLFRSQLQIVHHLQIKFCLNYVHRLSCCQSHYLALSKPEHPHQKYTVISLACLLGISQKVNWRNPFCLQYKFNTLLVEMAGVEPASRTHSLNQIYNNLSSCDNK